jgi:eukaryotic-like serine/threonine-protein kinase
MDTDYLDGRRRSTPKAEALIVIQLNLSSPSASSHDTTRLPADIQDIQQRLSVVVARKYRILKLLGSGGMATVWLVRHRIHGALFALKVLHPSLANIPELKEMFYREAVHAGALAGHPNIVPVFDIAHADGLHYLVMPYVRGCDLDEALRHCSRFHLNDALTTTLEITTTLAYAESCGILHGDLSPGNIRIDEFGRIFLLDFGLSRSIRAPSVPSSYTLGTPYAMSPEQIRGGAVDIRSDLYGVGILLFLMLTGQPPFRGDTIETIEEAHMRGQLLIPREIRQGNSQLSKLLERLLAKEAKDRPQNAATLKANLLQLGATHRPLEVASQLRQEEHVTFLRKRLSDADH